MSLPNIKPFLFWSQKVLPNVYDDSLSYYEVLTKIANSLNEVISATNLTVRSLLSEYDPLKTYEANEYCWYDDGIYKSRVETTGVFNIAAWEKVTFLDSVGVDINQFKAETNEDIDLFKSAVTNAINDYEQILYNCINSVATIYDETATYLVGAYVAYEGKVYVCDNNTTGEFNEDDWTAITIMPYLVHYINDLFTATVGLDDEFGDDETVAITQNVVTQAMQKLNCLPVAFLKGENLGAFDWNGYEATITHTGSTDVSQTISDNYTFGNLTPGETYTFYFEKNNDNISLTIDWYRSSALLRSDVISDTTEITIPSNANNVEIALSGTGSSSYTAKAFACVLKNNTTNNNLFELIGDLNQYYNSLKNNIVKDYSSASSSTYMVGDVVRYNDNIYVCYKAVTGVGTTHPWSGSENWVKVENLVDYVKTTNYADFYTIEKSDVNLCDVPLGRCYISPTGSIVATSSTNIYLSMIKPIKCQPSSTYNVCMFNAKPDSYSGLEANYISTPYVCCYNENLEFISRNNLQNKYGYNLNFNYTTDENTYYVLFYFYNTNAISDNARFQITLGETHYDYISPYNAIDHSARRDIALNTSEIGYLETYTGETFSTSKTYITGSVVKYNNELYRCFTPVLSAGAWSGGSNWLKITNIENYVENKTSKLELITNESKQNLCKVLLGRCNISAGGNVSAQGDTFLAMLEPIPCKSSTVYDIRIDCVNPEYTGEGTLTTSIAIIYYNENLEYDSRVAAGSAGGLSAHKNITTPATAKYMQVVFNNSNGISKHAKVQITEGSTSYQYERPYTGIDVVARNELSLKYRFNPPANTGVVIMGDSIVSGLGSDGYSTDPDDGAPEIATIGGITYHRNIGGNGWADKLKSYIENPVTGYHNLEVTINGISGGGITTLNDNLDLLVYNDNPDYADTKLVIVCIGIGDRNSSKGTVYSRYCHLFENLKNRGIEVLVLSPISHTIASTSLGTYPAEMNACCQKACRDTNTAYFNLYGEFNKAVGVGNLQNYLVDDKHPNQAGYNKMYDVITCMLNF